jgi:16S rRNA (cytosine967-C5)-methyltransferase
MTCSVLRAENDAQAEAFAQRHHWPLSRRERLTPVQGGDGFFLALFQAPGASD